RLEADVLAELGRDADAADAYRRCAAAGSAADRAAADVLLAALARRPPARRATSGEERERALALYREGVDRRLAKDYPGALRLLRQSYALSPHPLTIVQIAQVHRSAGHLVEFRKAAARALALAELLAGKPAEPRLAAGHATILEGVAWSPDGRRLASVDADGAVLIWDEATGRVIQRAASYQGADARKSLQWTPDGSQLAFIDDSQAALAIFDVVGGRSRILKPDTGEYLEAIAVSPDGAFVLLDVDDDVGDPKHRHLEVHRMAGGPAVASVPRAAEGPDATLLAGGTAVWIDGTTLMRFGPGDKQPRSTPLPGMKQIDEVAWAPAAGRFATSGDGRVAMLWSLADGTLIDGAGFIGGEEIDGLALSADGQRLAMAGDDTVDVWDFGKRMQVYSVEASSADVAMSADGLYLAVGTWTTVATARVDDRKDVKVLGGARQSIRDLQVSSDGARLLVCDERAARVFDLRGTAAPRQLVDGDVMFAAALPGGDLVTADPDGKIRRHRADGSVAATIDAGTSWKDPQFGLPQDGAMAASADGRLLAAGGDQGKAVRIFDAATGAERARLVIESPRGLALSADGSRLLAWRVTEVELWDVSTSRRIAMRDSFLTRPLTFLPDGRILHAGMGLLDADLSNHKGWSSDVSGYDGDLAVSRDGTRVAGGNGTTVGVASAVDGTVIWQAELPARVVAFTAPGLLATGGEDGLVRLIDDHGAVRATLYAPDERWVVITAGGRVDGSPGDDGGSSLIYWQVGDVQLPGWVAWDRALAPGALGAVESLAGAR
ncbi:MAG TPA: WD40 repeat domain-containing protein, partial [Kofleriaceae bacterium]|nr:WD40 repeat domain-containing protein [Kofleriaceae bacterium]